MKIRQQIILANILIFLIPTIIIGSLLSLFFSYIMISAPHNSILPVYELKLILSEIIRRPVILEYIVFSVLFSFLLILVTSTITTIVLSNNILIPINRLTHAAHNIKDGNLGFEILGTSCSEINELCYAFDEMRMQLKQSRLESERQYAQRRLMLANISHDIKTPLTSIKGYISGIKDGVASSPERMAKYLDTIYKKAEIMENMINNMSDLSMLEMSDISFNFEPTGINELIRSACEEYSCDEHSDIKLFLSDDDIILNLDHTQMRRVIRNIIDNSIKYRRADKCLIEIKTEYTNDGAVISVTDDGIGVDIDDTSRLFESFYRADPSRTPNITGSGLGLAIAKEIVEKHGGKIRLKNAQPHGVTVYIFLKGN